MKKIISKRVLKEYLWKPKYFAKNQNLLENLFGELRKGTCWRGSKCRSNGWRGGGLSQPLLPIKARGILSKN